MSKEVQIDEDACLGCEACVEICPTVFTFNETIGKAVVLSTATGDEDCIDEAIASCPANCISRS